MKVMGTWSWCMLEEYVKDIWTNTMQGFILTAIIAAVKCTLVLELT